MSCAVDDSPTLETMLNALAELEDIGIAAQELSDRYDKASWPYLRFRARELENECHNLFDVFELLSSGWEPTHHAHRRCLPARVGVHRHDDQRDG